MLTNEYEIRIKDLKDKLKNKTNVEKYKILWQWTKSSYVSFKEFVDLCHYLEDYRKNEDCFLNLNER